MSRHIYFLKYRRANNPNRTYHETVVARSADEARAFLALKDPLFGSTTVSPRRGRAVTPEAREFVEWRGTSVEVVD